MPVVAGVRLPREQTLHLAATLARAGFDHTSRVLLDAITNRHDLVSLSTDDREAIVAVLEHPPTDELVELRTVLFDELNWQRGAIHGARRSHRSPFATHG
ncbi:MAG TPA: hypothetical protein VH305_01365 [Gaiella sp.]|jgi:hypothetical protein